MTICPVCGGVELAPLFSVHNVPVVCNALKRTEADAKSAPCGDVDLVICQSCSYIFNASFDSARVAYVTAYENALHHSPSFRAFANDLVASLVERHALPGKRVVEIGCGDGFMLDLFVRYGAAEAVGFDPSMEGRSTQYSETPGVRIVPEYFRSALMGDDFDIIICRHVLEHLPDPASLLHDLQNQIGDRDVPIYFEVPNGAWMLDNVALWDVIYEHVSYFTPAAMETLFRRTGFMPTRLTSGYGDQFLLAEAVPDEADPAFVAPRAAETVGRAARFGAAAEDCLAEWRNRLSDHEGRVVLWGAGSKGISFVNAVSGFGTPIVAAVDLNPRKHGAHLPGAAVPIVPPNDLFAIDPNLVLISNGLYADEIIQTMNAMGLNPATAVVTT